MASDDNHIGESGDDDAEDNDVDGDDDVDGCMHRESWMKISCIWWSEKAPKGKSLVRKNIQLRTHAPPVVKASLKLDRAHPISSVSALYGKRGLNVFWKWSEINGLEFCLSQC